MGSDFRNFTGQKKRQVSTIPTNSGYESERDLIECDMSEYRYDKWENFYFVDLKKVFFKGRSQSWINPLLCINNPWNNFLLLVRCFV